MTRRLWLCVVLVLLLTGCAWMHSGSYTSVSPHEAEYAQDQPEQTTQVRNYTELLAVLQSMVDGRTESGILDVSEYGQSLEEEISRATQYITKVYPLGAYAVRSMNVVVDQTGASRRANVTIGFGVTDAQMRQIQPVRGKVAAEEAIQEALASLPSTLVLQISDYEIPDVAGTVARCAALYLDQIVEIPTVTVRTVPESGTTRILEITFSYSHTYAQLSAMRSQVQAVFDSAKNYVSDVSEPAVMAERLYSFLMSRFDYTVGVTTTPAYSLLCQGVGDSRAFAQVFAALCRQSGLTCYVVEGTRGGSPWCWNILELSEGSACHVDLLGDMEARELVRRGDEEMTDYTWDTEACPVCTNAPVETVPTEPAENS